MARSALAGIAADGKKVILREFELAQSESVKGSIMLGNLDTLIGTDYPKFEQKYIQDASIGLRVSEDGRIWLCINGVSFLRFKPNS